MARTYPDLPILLHHLAGVPGWADGVADGLRRVLPTLELPNVWVKVSGFTYGRGDPDVYPDASVIDVIQAFYDSWGPQRLVWGSDSPMVPERMTYGQALDVVRQHCAFIPQPDRD